MTARFVTGTCPLIVMCATVALFGAPLGAQAEPCDPIYDYTETYPGEQQADESVPLWGRGVAEGGYPCYVNIQVRLLGPSGQVLDERNAGYGAGPGSSIEASVGAFMTYDSPQGNYGTQIMTWVEGQHVGCATSHQLFGAGRFAYRQNYIINEFFANYVRCNPGAACFEMVVTKSKIRPPQSTWPLYIYMQLIWFGSNNACFGSNINESPICVADT